MKELPLGPPLATSRLVQERLRKLVALLAGRGGGEPGERVSGPRGR